MVDLLGQGLLDQMVEERGWAVFHDDDLAAGDVRYIERLAARLGTVSTRDGGVWPVLPRARAGTFSQTRGAAGFHTDAQYYGQPERKVLLFCIRASRCGGGVTRLLPARRVHEGLASVGLDADALALLRQPRWTWEVPAVFRRASVGGPAVPRCVLMDDRRIRWRYDNLSVESPTLRAVAAAFDRYLEAHPGQEYIQLKPGDVLCCDNSRVLHGRTPFEDPDRLLYRARLW